MTKIDLYVEEIDILSGVYGEPMPKIILKCYPNVYSDTEINTHAEMMERVRQVLGNLNHMILNKHKRLEGLRMVLEWGDSTKKTVEVEIPEGAFRIDPKTAKHLLFKVNELKVGFEEGQTEDEMKYVVGYNDAVNKIRTLLRKHAQRRKNK